MTIKTFKIIKVAPTCFGLHKPSSGSYSLCIAKITFLVPVYMSLQMFSVFLVTALLYLNTSFNRNYAFVSYLLKSLV